MPCTSGPSWDDEYRQRIDNLTALLCMLCKRCDKEGLKMPGDVREWWKEHQKLDKERRKTKEEARKKREAKQTLLNKLTVEERRLLGV